MTICRLAFILSIPTAAIACSNTPSNKATPDGPVAHPDAPEGTHDGPPSTAAVTLTTSGSLGQRLVDADGKTLYFFVNDVAGTGSSTYSGAAWPPFTTAAGSVGSGLSPNDFAQIDRGGGVSQTTWKGRPLYYYASDSMATPTAGEGIGGRWFVARDYDLFFGASSSVTPQGGSADAPFLTDGAGRTVYVFQEDTRGVNGGAPTSACSGECASFWPLWPAPSSLSGLALPSTIVTTNLTAFTNASQSQYVYLGWPLYYYASDTSPGQVAGAGVADWYAVDGGWNGTMTQ